MWFFIKRAKNDKKGQNIGKFGQKSENVNLKIFWKRARKGPARKGPACTSFFSCEFCQLFKNSCIFLEPLQRFAYHCFSKNQFFSIIFSKGFKNMVFFYPPACVSARNFLSQKWYNQRMMQSKIFQLPP